MSSNSTPRSSQSDINFQIIGGNLETQNEDEYEDEYEDISDYGNENKMDINDEEYIEQCTDELMGDMRIAVSNSVKNIYNKLYDDLLLCETDPHVKYSELEEKYRFAMEQIKFLEEANKYTDDMETRLGKAEYLNRAMESELKDKIYGLEIEKIEIEQRALVLEKERNSAYVTVEELRKEIDEYHTKNQKLMLLVNEYEEADNTSQNNIRELTQTVSESNNYIKQLNDRISNYDQYINKLEKMCSNQGEQLMCMQVELDDARTFIAASSLCSMNSQAIQTEVVETPVLDDFTMQTDHELEEISHVKSRYNFRSSTLSQRN